MNFKRISIQLLQAAALVVWANMAVAQVQNATGAAAPSPAAVTQSGDKGVPAVAPQAVSDSALRLVEQEAAGRDSQGSMRIKLISGGIKLPANL